MRTGSMRTGGSALRALLSSARLRIVGWFILLLALALFTALLALRLLLLDGLEERIQQEMVQEVEELRSLAGGLDPADGQPFGSRIDRLFEVFLQRNLPLPNETMVTFIDGELFLRSLGEPPLRLDRQPQLVARWRDVTEPSRGQVTTDEVGRIDYLAVPLQLEGAPQGVFVVAAFTDIARQDVDEVVRVTALVGLGALLLGAALSWSVSGRVLAPVRELTQTARTISETDLGGRIEVTGDDEIGQLAVTFNAMLDRLEGAFITQRHFIDDAGHELRTPITIIRGHLELLEDDPAERAETIDLVLDELDRMNRMVEDLLVLAKAQRPDFLNLAVTDLNPLVAEIHAKATAMAPRRWALEVGSGGRIVADGQRLTQAVVQLAANAVQHTADGDTITIGSDVADEQTCIWVRDEGPGIAPEDQERIFSRFSRGAGARRSSDGAGLGLSIVKAIAEAHGGRLHVSSTPGAGATFTLTIPVDPQEELRT
jgi:two-component system, OmpR family, sensor kinase